MDSTNDSVARLSSDQVNSLLAFGLMPPRSRTATTVLDLLMEALDMDEPSDLDELLGLLQREILGQDDGPLSFARLAPLSAAESEPLRGKTLWTVLTSPDTSRTVLEHLAEYGGTLAGEIFLPATRIRGEGLRVLALAALARGHAVPIDDSEATCTTAILEVLAMFPTLPDWFRIHALDAVGRLTARQAPI
jgi:hypothetical protein